MHNSIENFLEAADGAGRVIDHARLISRLSNLYQRIAPAYLGQSSELVNYKSGTVVIHAASGAVATKLRQLAPTLCEGFSQRGIECSDLQIKVQAPKTIAQSTSSTLKPLSKHATGQLEALRDTLPESPLKAAIDTLIIRSAKSE